MGLESVNKTKNIKISENHHKILKLYCDKNGLKIYKVLEKWIDEHCSSKKKDSTKDLYGDD
jgi:coproporphyrinogen III oxidase